MKVKDLLTALQAVPPTAEVTFCGSAENPYNDYWEARALIRITDLKDSSFDRVCLMAQ